MEDATINITKEGNQWVVSSNLYPEYHVTIPVDGKYTQYGDTQAAEKSTIAYYESEGPESLSKYKEILGILSDFGVSRVNDHGSIRLESKQSGETLNIGKNWDPETLISHVSKFSENEQDINLNRSIHLIELAEKGFNQRVVENNLLITRTATQPIAISVDYLRELATKASCPKPSLGLALALKETLSELGGMDTNMAMEFDRLLLSSSRPISHQFTDSLAKSSTDFADVSQFSRG